jgi:dTDP-4-dehydrorhamnose reductase
VAVAGPVLVTGAGGLLGGQVAWTFAQQGVDVYAFTHAQLDITDADSCLSVVRNTRPALVVNCAALTNVDRCETEPDLARAINAEGAGNIAAAAIDVAAAIVHVSTDYVFDGDSGGYTEADPTNPIQVYGVSKLQGEERVVDANPFHYVVRSAWIYGPGGKNLLSKLPELVASDTAFTPVTDQFGSPTYAPDLAQAIADLAASGVFGIYHVVNEGRCSFAEFCDAAVAILGADLDLTYVTLDALGRPASRPRDTSLVGEAWARAGFLPLRPWRDAAEAFLGGPEADPANP